MESSTETTAQPPPTTSRPGIVRRLYDWVLQWADHAWSTWALFFIALTESFIFPIPPDVLLMALALGKPKQSMRFAAVCTIGSVVGAIVGFYIGLLFKPLAESIVEFYGVTGGYEALKALYNRNLLIVLGTAALTPIPFKVFTIAAGVAEVPFLQFILISAVFRGARFFAVAALFYKYGPPVKALIDRYFNLVTIVFMVLLIGGFVVVRWVMN